MKRIAVIFIPLFLTLSACRKDEKVSIIQFGDTKNMDTTFYMVGLNGGQSTYNDCQELDLNKDGINDISICSTLSGSLGSGYYNGAHIEVLNENLQLSGYLANDSTYLLHDTTYRESPINEGEIMMSITKKYACTKIDEEYKLVSVQQDKFYLSQFEEEDYLNMSEMFIIDEPISLLADKYSPPYSSYSAGTDTTAYVFNTPKGNCNYLPDGELHYIGFRLLDDNQKTIFGWIKLGTNLYNSKVYISETAILKESN